MHEILTVVTPVTVACLSYALTGRILDAWTERARLRLKTEQIKDRIFRDACDTIHHLRVENDALTNMVMAMQKAER